jgi:hypothetical protein
MEAKDHFMQVYESIRLQARVMLAVIFAMLAVIVYLSVTRTTVVIKPSSFEGACCVQHYESHSQNYYAADKVYSYH